MSHPTGFDSWHNYFQFSLANEFVGAEGNNFQYQRNDLEKTGYFLSSFVTRPLNFTLKNIKNPLFILALAITCIAITTIIFYPAHFMFILAKTIPFVFRVQPWMVKAAVFTILETTIFGLGLRTFGRVCNLELLHAWQQKEVIPVFLGDILIQRPE